MRMRHIITILLLFNSALVSAYNPPKQLKLKNGIKVLLDRDDTSRLTAVQIWVDVGAANEDTENAGISHFIEHTIFKGTKEKQQKDIAPAIEKVGGIINAATSKDFTYFFTVIPSSYCLEGVEILADAVSNPEFPTTEIEKERNVILEEIKRKDDNPQSELFDNFYELVYGTSPYGCRTIGNEKTVSGITREDLLLFHKKYYTADRMHVVIAGNFDEKKVMSALASKLGKINGGKKPDKKAFFRKLCNIPPIGEAALKIIRKNVAQTYIIMGFPAATVNNKDQYQLDLISYVFGSGRASRLNKKLVEDMKLAYNISASFSTQKGPGLFYVYAECKPENAATLINNIKMELFEFSMSGVSVDEVKRAKTLLLRDKLLERQTPDGWAEEIGFYSVLGAGDIPGQYIKKIKKIKPRQLPETFLKYFVFPNIPTAIVMPEDEKQK